MANNNQGGPDAISCVSESFCMLGDQEGSALEWDGESWHESVSVFGPYEVQSLSCTSDEFCVAVSGGDDSFGYHGVAEYALFDGSGWTVGPLDVGYREIVSCASETFCVAVGSRGTATFDGTSWSQPEKAPGNLIAISCPTVGFCLALDNGGRYETFDGATWSGPTKIFPRSTSLHPSVDCVSPQFCITPIGDTKYATYDGSEWTQRPGPPNDPVISMSCSGSTYCVGIGLNSLHLLSSGRWTDLGESADPLRVLSCGAQHFCAGASYNGDVQFVRGTALNAPHAVDPFHGKTQSISCTSSTFCAAVDQYGDALTFDGTSWTKPQLVSEYTFSKVSCTSPSFCAAVGGYSPAAQLYDGTGWQTSPLSKRQYLGQLSCVTSFFCIAADGAGRSIRYTGSEWTVGATISTARRQPHGLSCSSKTFCGAIDSAGQFATFDGTAWTPAGRPADSRAELISCASRTFCMASVKSRAARSMLKFDGATWSVVPVSGLAAIADISCAKSTTFCAAVDGDHDVITWDGVAWSAPVAVGVPGDQLSSISCPTESFCAVTGSAGTFYTTVS